MAPVNAGFREAPCGCCGVVGLGQMCSLNEGGTGKSVAKLHMCQGCEARLFAGEMLTIDLGDGTVVNLICTGGGLVQAVN